VLEPPQEKERESSDLPWGIFAVVLLLAAVGFAAWGFYSRESQKSGTVSASSAAAPSTSPAATGEASPPASKPGEPVVAAPAPEPAQSQPVITPSPPAGPAHANLVVVIKAREDSWLSISVDGEIVTRALLTAAGQKSIRAEKEIAVRAGNIGALDFEFNGHKLPTQGDYGEVKTLTFDARGLQASAVHAESPAEAPRAEETPTKPQ
jgi:cytoskeletal protein RodZ